jgi:DNA polymerase-3 subunit chi
LNRVTDVYFYHLQRQALERVLPMLLEKGLQRGWRAVVQTASAARLAELDDALWTYSDESFLPHGSPADGDADLQPVCLTDGPDNPNGAALRLLVDGSDASEALQRQGAPGYERAVIVFDGGDAEQLANARAQWTTLKDAGHAVTYWQQNDDGRWEKKA